jgi:hypothetical protein
VEHHKVVVGLVLGAIAVATGFGALLVAGGAIEAVTAGTVLGWASLSTGAAAATLDGRDCVANFGINGACTATFLGGVGSVMALPELGVEMGAFGMTEPPFQEFLGLAVGGLYLSDAAVLLDAGRAIYDRVRYGHY